MLLASALASVSSALASVSEECSRCSGAEGEALQQTEAFRLARLASQELTATWAQHVEDYATSQLQLINTTKAYKDSLVAAATRLSL